MKTLALSLLLIPAICSAQETYDLLLKGGHVIDPKNHLNAVRDVAIAQGRIAAVVAEISVSKAYKTVNVAGLYVTPGLVDIHTHVFACCRPPKQGPLSVYPDSHTFRSGVTTVWMRERRAGALFPILSAT